jgi:methylmalonyl-CoA mutase
MLDFADFVAINKFDRKGAQDALRDVRKQVQRNRELFKVAPDEMPCTGRSPRASTTTASPRSTRRSSAKLVEKGLRLAQGTLRGRRRGIRRRRSSSCRRRASATSLRSPNGTRLSAWAREPPRGSARERQQLRSVRRTSRQAKPAERRRERSRSACRRARREARPRARRSFSTCGRRPKDAYSGDEYVVKIRDKEIRTALTTTSLSGTKIRKVVLPRFEDDGEILRWQLVENVPGSFPFTAGVFAFKRENEDPTRMFAGEGDAFRTQPPLSSARRRHACEAAFHGVRLGHALRQRSRQAVPTSTARSATRACRSPRSTT